MSIRHTRKQWSDLQDQEKNAKAKELSRAERKRLGEVGHKSGNFVPRLHKALRALKGSQAE